MHGVPNVWTRCASVDQLIYKLYADFHEVCPVLVCDVPLLPYLQNYGMKMSACCLPGLNKWSPAAALRHSATAPSDQLATTTQDNSKTPPTHNISRNTQAATERQRRRQTVTEAETQKEARSDSWLCPVPASAPCTQPGKNRARRDVHNEALPHRQCCRHGPCQRLRIGRDPARHRLHR